MHKVMDFRKNVTASIRRFCMKSFLFDLDGTLLAVSDNDFAHAYFHELVPALRGLLPIDGLGQTIMRATLLMQNDLAPTKNNMDKFRDILAGFYPTADREAVWSRLMEFYASTFDNIHSIMGPNLPLLRAIRYLRSHGNRILLTTNPIFPQIATYKRLTWAGFTPESFEYVSTMENCSACKPHIEYWQNVIREKKVDPAQAIAIGNDCVEDVSARFAGIETYLVTDYVIGDPMSAEADHVSDATGFERWAMANY